MPDLNDAERQALIPEDLIFLGYRGSIAHGMYIPGTDPDSIEDKERINAPCISILAKHLRA